MSIIALGLAGNLCDQYFYCSWNAAISGGTNAHAAAAMGICAGVFGMVFSSVGICWMILSELWDVGILKFVLMGGYMMTALFAFISAVIFCVVASSLNGTAFTTMYGITGAAAAFQFFLMIFAILAGIFCLLAGGGGTGE